MTKPALALALLVVLAGTWQVALRPAVPAPPAPGVPVETAARSVDVPPTVRLDLLSGQGNPAPAPREWRNPFAGGRAAAPAAVAAGGAGRAPNLPAPDGAAAPAASPWPQLALIGVAEAGEGTDLVRTAIVSGPKGVHHARPGDVLEQVYRVERIDSGGVDLDVLPEGRRLRLALRP